MKQMKVSQKAFHKSVPKKCPKNCLKKCPKKVFSLKNDPGEATGGHLCLVY